MFYYNLIDLQMILSFLAIAILCIPLGYFLNRVYFSGGVCRSTKRLDGKVAIITGGNTGIGYETALDFAKRGARVILACRDTKKAEKAAKRIVDESGNKSVEVEFIDLSDLETVREFAQRMNASLKQLDLLVNNAGVMMCPRWKTKQGFEMQFGTNHLGHFVLTNLLLDLIKRADKARIINVSSRAHYDGFGMNWDDLNWEKSYNTIFAYAQSKLANVLFSKELATRLAGTGIIAVSLHPGVVRTDLTQHLGASLSSIVPLLMSIFHPFYWVISKSSAEGAQTTIHCALDDDVAKFNGCYFSDCKPKTPRKDALKPENAKRLWEASEKLVGKYLV